MIPVLQARVASGSVRVQDVHIVFGRGCRSYRIIITLDGSLVVFGGKGGVAVCLQLCYRHVVWGKTVVLEVGLLSGREQIPTSHPSVLLASTEFRAFLHTSDLTVN